MKKGREKEKKETWQLLPLLAHDDVATRTIVVKNFMKLTKVLEKKKTRERKREGDMREKEKGGIEKVREEGIKKGREEREGKQRKLANCSQVLAHDDAATRTIVVKNFIKLTKVLTRKEEERERKGERRE